jgi:hypothetical protein
MSEETKLQLKEDAKDVFLMVLAFVLAMWIGSKLIK